MNVWPIVVGLLMPFTVFSAPVSTLDCGTYRATGRLIYNSAGLFVLRSNPASPTAQELILAGGDAGEKLKYLNQPVRAEFYVPKVIQPATELKLVFHQKIIGHAPGFDRPPELIAKEKCGIGKKYAK